MRASGATELGTGATEASVVGSASDGAAPLAVADSALRKRAAERLANVERLRIVAMLEIVTFHVGGAFGDANYRLPLVAGLGLPVFLLLNSAFNCTLVERRGTRAFLDAKVSRLLVPWLVWSAVYAGLVLFERLRHHEPLADAFSPWMILGGTYTHLWFVPFALFGSALVAGVQVQTKRVLHPIMAGVAYASGCVLVLLVALLAQRSVIRWPLAQWLFALPSPLLGLALGRVLLSDDRRLLRWQALLSCGVALAGVALTFAAPVSDLVRRYAISMALVGLFFLWPGRSDALSQRLTPLLFGVYLTHPLLLRAYQGAHLPALPPALLGVLVFLAAAAFVQVLRRTALRSLV